MKNAFWTIIAALLYFPAKHAASFSKYVVPQNFPTFEEFKGFMVNQQGLTEVIKQSMYDSAVYPAAGIAGQLQFFAAPVGQGVSSSPGNAAAPKSIADTNMTVAGMLPAPQGFWIQSIELDFQPGNTTGASWTIDNPIVTTPTFSEAAIGGGANDVNAFYSAGALVLTIGTKPYLQEAPLLYFPPKARFEMDAALSGVTNATSVVVSALKLKAGGRPYQLQPGLALQSSQNFGVTLNWPAAVATPSGFPGRVMCKLDGWLFRAVQ